MATIKYSLIVQPAGLGQNIVNMKKKITLEDIQEYIQSITDNIELGKLHWKIEAAINNQRAFNDRDKYTKLSEQYNPRC